MMGHIDFEKETIVVLNTFEAAAFVNEWLYRKGEEQFNSCADDAIEYGCQTFTMPGYFSLLTPLNDDQFGYWSVEPIGNIVRHSKEELLSKEREFFFVVPNESTKRALGMFDTAWRSHRAYTLRYTEN